MKWMDNIFKKRKDIIMTERTCSGYRPGQIVKVTSVNSIQRKLGFKVDGTYAVLYDYEDLVYLLPPIPTTEKLQNEHFTYDQLADIGERGPETKIHRSHDPKAA